MSDDVKAAITDALAHYLLGVNERMNGPFIPPTAIGWLRVEAAEAAFAAAVEAGMAPPAEVERLRDRVEIERHQKRLERRKWLRAEREVDDLYRAIARHRDSGEHPGTCRPCEVCEESDNRLWRTIERTPDERLEVRRQADRYREAIDRIADHEPVRSIHRSADELEADAYRQVRAIARAALDGDDR